MKHVSTLILSTLIAGTGLAAADAGDVRIVRPGEGDSVQESDDLVMVPRKRPVDMMVMTGRNQSHPAFQQKTVNSHVVFMNNCQPSGCQVKPGTDDSTQDTSSVASRAGVLTAYPNDGSWSQLMSCVKQTMSRFNIQVVDVDPGSQPHFEVMVAGVPTAIGLPEGVGGVAPLACNDVGDCDPYVANGLVFDFVNDMYVKPLGVTEWCAIAAQEVAHAWMLDHVVEKTDPMTYNDYSGMRNYQDGMKCGSDCQSGQSPLGLPCTGSGGQATHVCFSNNNVTQNDVQMITALFGSANATKPTVAITAPANGATVGPTFDVSATCTVPDSTVQQIDVYVDGNLGKTLVASPYTFQAQLQPGTHKLTATCTTAAQAQASADVTVNVGTSSGCNDNGCPTKGDVCVNNTCVAGANTPGGFGATCTGNSDCTSGLCAGDGTNHYCVITCTLGADNSCPSGSDCTDAGSMGVCFPGAGGGGGGGCSTSGDSAPMFLGLGGFIALVIRRRRSRK